MLYHCDVITQGLQLPVTLCDECIKRLEKQGATMKCMPLPQTKTRCVMCTNDRPNAQHQLSYYERRRCPF